jgi:hypothetical protein
MVFILCGGFAVLQAPLFDGVSFDGVSFDPFPFD